jgi:ABC-type transport system involved in cytochrome bd biosynthesis fused ATPase/permease subunit
MARRDTGNAAREQSGARIMWRMLGFVRPLAGVMVVSVACGVAGFCCATGIPVLAAEEVLALAGAGSLAWPLATVCWVLAAMALARGVLHYVEQRCNHYIAFRLLAHIRDLVFGSLRKLAPAKLAGRDRGNLVSTVTSDVELLEVFFAHTISPICIAVLMAVVGAVFLWQLAPAFALVALVAWALVGVAVPLAVSRCLGRRRPQAARPCWVALRLRAGRPPRPGRGAAVWCRRVSPRRP